MMMASGNGTYEMSFKGVETLKEGFEKYEDGVRQSYVWVNV